ncbi:hypothetical protein CR513_29887, partial [Mucuna pruriens]
MLDKGCSNKGFAIVIRNDFRKDQPPKENLSQRVVVENTTRIANDQDIPRLYGKEKFLERMGRNKGPTQMWVNQTTSNKENVVEHPSTSQLDQDIQAFSKEEIDHLRALLNSTSKSLGSCGLTMKVSKVHLITIANGDHVPIVGSDNSSLSLHNVLHVSKLANNLISIHRFIQDWNCSVTFFHSHYVIQELTTGRTIGVAKEQGGLYYLQHAKVGNNINKEDLPSNQRATLKTWAASQIWLYHKRLGHPPFELLKAMFPYLFTRVCQFSKHNRATFSPSNNKSLEPFDHIHSNVWGLASNSIFVAKWFVSFIDDCTRMKWIFLMKHKSEVCQIFVDFFCLVKNQFGKSIKRLWLDNGTEFVNLEFSKFLKDNGVIHELTCVNTPQQNGVVERKNHHLLEVSRALLWWTESL